ncbi:hypothetical protein CALCODRAFT_490174 [Calocera cornea HHB12733]|uniref:Uncharacterized protein n=1 Tax=Calocera cornea HHB12733 TaxID=1353952 RepID=A0A165JWH8_9BASI|nr:hypothetical protein CALCODRAFT_490174 [Calocera cornea HHB12733]
MIPSIRRIRLNSAQRRSITSTLFTVTFIAAVATVAFPCPARDRHIRGMSKEEAAVSGDIVRTSKRRWIEEVQR